MSHEGGGIVESVLLVRVGHFLLRCHIHEDAIRTPVEGKRVKFGQNLAWGFECRLDPRQGPR
jgi:hypothetical protein